MWLWISKPGSKRVGLPLGAGPQTYFLPGKPESPVVVKTVMPCAQLIRKGPRGGGWYLTAPADARAQINGKPVNGTPQMLRDRDVITVGQTVLEFSVNGAAAAHEFHGVNGEKAPNCPVCSKSIEPGHLVVQCPNPKCGRLYHQSAEHGNCWTHDSRCRICGHSTKVDSSVCILRV